VASSFQGSGEPVKKGQNSPKKQIILYPNRLFVLVAKGSDGDWYFIPQGHPSARVLEK